MEPAASIAVVAGTEKLGIGASVEWRRSAKASFELMFWLSPPYAHRYVAAGSFWTAWTFGGESYVVRFEHRINVLNRALFEAVELLPERALSQLPQDALWLLSEHRTPQTGEAS